MLKKLFGKAEKPKNEHQPQSIPDEFEFIIDLNQVKFIQQFVENQITQVGGLTWMDGTMGNQLFNITVDSRSSGRSLVSITCEKMADSKARVTVFKVIDDPKADILMRLLHVKVLSHR